MRRRLDTNAKSIFRVYCCEVPCHPVTIQSGAYGYQRNFSLDQNASPDSVVRNPGVLYPPDRLPYGVIGRHIQF